MANEYLYATARFTTAGGKSLAKQSPPLTIRDVSTGLAERYTEGTHNILIYPGTSIVVSMFASGGGGGASVYFADGNAIDGSKGGDVVVSFAGGSAVAGGGNGGLGSVWDHGDTHADKFGAGGLVDVSNAIINPAFSIIESANGTAGYNGTSLDQGFVVGGFVNEFGDRNNGGNGGTGMEGDGNGWTWGGNGGSGAYVKVNISNVSAVAQYATIVVGTTGKGARYGSLGWDAGIATAIVIR